jgi:hypothetical protein
MRKTALWTEAGDGWRWIHASRACSAAEAYGQEHRAGFNHTLAFLSSCAAAGK